MKFDGTECVDAVLDCGACITAVSGRFFDKINVNQKDGDKIELKKVMVKLSVASIPKVDV